MRGRAALVVKGGCFAEDVRKIWGERGKEAGFVELGEEALDGAGVVRQGTLEGYTRGGSAGDITGGY